MTTYDTIWTEYLTNCHTDNINLPSVPEKIYDVIHSAIRHYNVRMGDNIAYDDTLEQLDRDLSESQLLITTHYLRLTFFENQLISLTTTWQPYLKELGLRNYQEQSRTLKQLITDEKQEIESIITNSFVGDLM